LVKDDKTHISDFWNNYFQSFVQTLTTYLTAYGVFLPRLTTAQRDAIQRDPILGPQEGQMIYNIDATPGPPRSGAIQVWQVKAGVGAWRTFTTTP
jgi:hypothetical protein